MSAVCGVAELQRALQFDMRQGRERRCTPQGGLAKAYSPLALSVPHIQSHVKSFGAYLPCSLYSMHNMAAPRTPTATHMLARQKVFSHRGPA